jgi:hypothetical protein
MKRVNVPVRFVLGLRFRTPLSGLLLSYTGRKTGRFYRQPISYVRDGDVLLTPGRGKWKLNLRENEPVPRPANPPSIRLTLPFRGVAPTTPFGLPCASPRTRASTLFRPRERFT